MTRTHRIAGRFDAAASTYEHATPIQRQIADALADEIEAENLPAGGRVLELGCGAGYLTRRLVPTLAPSLWIAGDLAPAMLAALRRRQNHPAVSTVLMDAQAPALAPGFDLVCSSLTLQWLADPAAVTVRWRDLLAPGGLLAYATLVKGSFAEWRAALAAAGAPEPEPAFPSLAELRAWTPAARVRTLTLVERHEDSLGFLRAARAAGVDAGLGRPLHAGTMRHALRALDHAGARITYQAALVLLRPGADDQG
jgi:malonyl-CoA O-methyltransferase